MVWAEGREVFGFNGISEERPLLGMKFCSGEVVRGIIEHGTGAGGK